MSDLALNLTPDPKVLVALTRTPLKPMDALCELLDNALDGFHHAEMAGSPTPDPLVTIDLPGRAEVDRGAGVIRVRDNGPGMSTEVAEKALRAGYSANNPFDTLGLFGMGFNISTGKLGKNTVFRTARSDGNETLEVEIDLVEIQRAGSYDVPARTYESGTGPEHGSIVEVSGWWPEGDPNAGFASKLAAFSKNQVRAQIGRRYATILRDQGVRILVNKVPCEPSELCVWSRERYVERAGRGQIHAREEFDYTVGKQRRCRTCFTLVPGDDGQCPACGSSSFRSITQRVRGWLGVQRFDDLTTFGVDLIRNGRAIRVGEKSAFFEFVDDLGNVTKDYPIDQQYGRIVGEVHLDHVPVDFQKQDFERSTPEWSEAMRFLRGESSLQPNKPGADSNDSPMFRLYQGFRKVRNVGKRDMYMGVWEPGAERPRRAPRELEREYFERFLERKPGYYEDTEWWKLVEQADRRPVEELEECPECGMENLKSAQECPGCGHVLIGRACGHCGETIPVSAQNCPHCGQSQIPEDTSPWDCKICGSTNSPEVEECGKCHLPRETPALGSPDFLKARARRAEGLCRKGVTVRLADDTQSTPLDVEVYLTTGHIEPAWEAPAVPAVIDKGEALTIFVDPKHETFTGLDTRVEVFVAAEIAQFIYIQHQRLVGTSPGHSISNLASCVLGEYYDEALDISPEHVKSEVADAFTGLRRRLAENVHTGEARQLFEQLTAEQQAAFADNLIAGGRALSEAEEAIESGEFIDFVEPDALVSLFVARPEMFMSAPGASRSTDRDLTAAVEGKLRRLVGSALEECSDYLHALNPSPSVTRRSRGSLEYLVTQLEL